MLEIDEAKKVVINVLTQYQAQCHLPKNFNKTSHPQEKIAATFSNWFHGYSGLTGFMLAEKLMTEINLLTTVQALIALIIKTNAGPKLKPILQTTVLQIMEISDNHIVYLANKISKAKNKGLNSVITTSNPLYYQPEEFIKVAKLKLYEMAIQPNQSELNNFILEANVSQNIPLASSNSR